MKLLCEAARLGMEPATYLAWLASPLACEIQGGLALSTSLQGMRQTGDTAHRRAATATEREADKTKPNNTAKQQRQFIMENIQQYNNFLQISQATALLSNVSEACKCKASSN